MVCDKASWAISNTLPIPWNNKELEPHSSQKRPCSREIRKVLLILSSLSLLWSIILRDQRAMMPFNVMQLGSSEQIARWRLWGPTRSGAAVNILSSSTKVIVVVVALFVLRTPSSLPSTFNLPDYGVTPFNQLGVVCPRESLQVSW